MWIILMFNQRIVKLQNINAVEFYAVSKHDKDHSNTGSIYNIIFCEKSNRQKICHFVITVVKKYTRNRRLRRKFIQISWGIG